MVLVGGLINVGPPSAASFGFQRAAATRGLDHLLPPGLGPGRRQLFAKQLPSSFSVLVQGDEDLEFAALAAAAWGPFLPNFRSSQLQLLCKVHAAVQPLAEWARSAQSPSAHRIAVVKDLAFIAAWSALLRWPDIHQAAACILGFRIVSDIKSSNVFRELQPSTANRGNQAFLDRARECDNLTRRPGPEHADGIFRFTQEDIHKTCATGLLSREAADQNAWSWRLEADDQNCSHTGQWFTVGNR